MIRLSPLFWLIFLFLVAAFVATAEAASRYDVKKMVMREAADSKVPVSLALAVAKVESDFNAKALSSAGARGVMQIMPATARNEFGVSPNRLWDARTNIRLGVTFLEQLHAQYNGRWDLALSHYNGGTVKGNQPHKFTRKYIRMVKKWQAVYQEQANLWDVDRAPVFNEDEIDLVELREWRPRYLEDGRNDAGREYDDEDEWRDEVEEDWNETRIIVVERTRPDHRWGRPPPPPPFGRHPGRGRPYFH